MSEQPKCFAFLNSFNIFIQMSVEHLLYARHPGYSREQDGYYPCCHGPVSRGEKHKQNGKPVRDCKWSDEEE